MLTGLLFSRAFCRPSRVTARTMGPMEGANWTVRTCIYSHWLCGPLAVRPTGCAAHWSVIGQCVGVMAAHGVSLGVVFATSLPTHPPLPVPPHPSPSHPTPPRLPSHPPPLLSILTAERDGKKIP